MDVWDMLGLERSLTGRDLLEGLDAARDRVEAQEPAARCTLLLSLRELRRLERVGKVVRSDGRIWVDPADLAALRLGRTS